MYTIDNKFEIGEECYTYARENMEVECQCPVCKGKKRLYITIMKFLVNNAIFQAGLLLNKPLLCHTKLES